MTDSCNEKDTIQRCPHDSKNPYTMILNALIRDINISPNCRWLLIYLLSNNNNWKIQIAQVIEHVKTHMGRDLVYKIFDEAIQAGYIKREINKKGNLKNGYRYYVSETPKFKKCFRHPDSQDTEFQDTENTDYNKEQLLLTEEEQQTTEQGSCSSSVVSSQQKESNSSPSPEEITHEPPIQQEEISKPVVWKDEAAKRLMLEPYELTPKMIENIMPREIDAIKSSVAAFEQYRINKKIDNVAKALYSAIIQGWKPNFSVKDKIAKIIETEKNLDELVYERKIRCQQLAKTHHEGIRKRGLFKTNYTQVDEKGNHVCIGNDKLYFDDKNFDNMLQHLIRKYEIYTD